MPSVDNLDDYLNQKLIDNGVPLFESQNDCDQYVNMSMEDLKRLSAKGAIEVAYQLRQAAGNVQKRASRLESKLLYVKSNLNKALATVYESYNSFNGHELILAQACNDHEHINALQELKLETEAELQDIKFLANHIKDMAKEVSNLSWKK